MNSKTIGNLLGECYLNVTNSLHRTTVCYLVVTLIFLSGTYALYGGTYTLSSPDNSVKAAPPLKVLLADVRADSTDKVLTPGIAETASAMAFASSSAFELISPDILDSLADAMPEPLSITHALRVLHGDVGAYITVNRIHNLVRAEVILQDSTERRGVGYAVMSLVRDSAKYAVADPTVLLAVQRALMACMNNPNLYTNAEELFRAQEAPLVVAGAIVFEPTPANLPPWSLYKEKVTASYDGLQTIIATLHDRKDLAVVDTDTRDSMMAKAGLYLIENYNPITPKERTIYYAFGLNAIITGTISRVVGGADLTLTYSTIERDKMVAIRSRTVRIKLDGKVEFRNAVEECTRLLFSDT